MIEGREVKPDKRMPPLVSSDGPGTDMTQKVLLVETDSPDEPGKITTAQSRTWNRR